MRTTWDPPGEPEDRCYNDDWSVRVGCLDDGVKIRMLPNGDRIAVGPAGESIPDLHRRGGSAFHPPVWADDPPPPRNVDAHPLGIDVATGSFLRTEVDVALPGPEMGLALRRTYNSHDNELGFLGFGWKAALVDEKVKVGGIPTTAWWTGPDGVPRRFREDNYSDDARVLVSDKWRMRWEGERLGREARWIEVREPDGTVRHYDAMAELLDPDYVLGSYVGVRYRLTWVSRPGGGKITVTWRPLVYGYNRYRDRDLWTAVPERAVLWSCEDDPAQDPQGAESCTPRELGRLEFTVGAGEDADGDGTLDPGEDLDGDGTLDGWRSYDIDGDGTAEARRMSRRVYLARVRAVSPEGGSREVAYLWDFDTKLRGGEESRAWEWPYLVEARICDGECGGGVHPGGKILASYRYRYQLSGDEGSGEEECEPWHGGYHVADKRCPKFLRNDLVEVVRGESRLKVRYDLVGSKRKRIDRAGADVRRT